jgi:hypothetical protein
MNGFAGNQHMNGHAGYQTHAKPPYQTSPNQMAEQYSPNYQNFPIAPPPPLPPQPYYPQYDQYQNYINSSANYQVPPPNPAPVDQQQTTAIPHYSPVYNHQVITRKQEPVSQAQQHQMSPDSRPAMYSPTRRPLPPMVVGRAPLPQPRNSYYYSVRTLEYIFRSSSTQTKRTFRSQLGTLFLFSFKLL